MTSSNLSVRDTQWNAKAPVVNVLNPQRANSRAKNLVVVNGEELIWKSFLASNPVIKFLRPDYYLIFRFGDTCKILYQENVNLDLGGLDVNLENVYKCIVRQDLEHIVSTDKVMIQLIQERMLQPWDYIYKICGNVNSPNPGLKRLMRSSILIHRDPHGKEHLGFMCFHDVSAMVSSIKPNGYEIACEPELDFLSDEIGSRLRKMKGPRMELTRREKEIIECLRKGLSSKEIAGALFISVATVNTHRQNMLRKWEVTNTAALLQKCIEEDLL